MGSAAIGIGREVASYYNALVNGTTFNHEKYETRALALKAAIIKANEIYDERK